MSDKTDMVNHPPHYKDSSGVECIEVTKHMGFCGGNCFKYLYRAGKKGDFIEDLKKAKWYAERAWIMQEVVPDEAVKVIREVMRYREGNIYKAMSAIKSDLWADVERYIIAEIERLVDEQTRQ
ncbi:DUF3310 domain-containing protein [Psychrobacter sp. I-STPA6b]|uniref:DUF3310 domain-containing protein n=1 Tax=Psychrobacter sp. I-STPA6b TaxID=2585718 RepID=UPI001D0C0E83|nr:DUF3310 domain-containing protein [Psychrobacter sp. I-STPA6b]